jgi:hypothetical protein
VSLESLLGRISESSRARSYRGPREEGTRSNTHLEGQVNIPWPSLPYFTFLSHLPYLNSSIHITFQTPIYIPLVWRWELFSFLARLFSTPTSIPHPARSLTALSSNEPASTLHFEDYRELLNPVLPSYFEIIVCWHFHVRVTMS